MDFQYVQSLQTDAPPCTIYQSYIDEGAKFSSDTEQTPAAEVLAIFEYELSFG